MTNKKQTIIRLAVYLLISFGLTFSIFFIYVGNFGWTVSSSWYGVMATVAMLMPAIANILTRMITKEGLEDSYLSVKFKGKVRYYVIALVLPVIIGMIIPAASVLILLPQGSLGKVTGSINLWEVFCNTIYIAGVTVANLLLGFGEEFGWRAYLIPKLEKLMPFPAAIFVGGVIWGLWHAPIIACGHNFGKGYSGDPWLGIVLMCIFCVMTGVYLTALTKATGSVFAASLAHIAINNICSTVTNSILVSDENIALQLTEKSFEFSVINMGIICTLTMVSGIIILLIMKKSSSDKKE